MPSGKLLHAGDGTGTPVRIAITDKAAMWRLLFDPDLAVGEAYMDGTLVVEDGDIYDFLALLLSNIGWRGGTRFQLARRRLRQIVQTLRLNSPIKSKDNVAHHYDLSASLYELFLDADRQYSCAYYATPYDTLEEAQEQKKRHLAAKLLLQPGHRVLDIGCGWGGLALSMARMYKGVHVTGITLSEEQLAVARNRAAAEGLADRVDFQLIDYRHVEGNFDRIVSVGMFEHVGTRHYEEYFQTVANLLTNDGVAVIHTIGRAEGPNVTNPWFQKYIFPGGYSPALSEVVPAIEQVGLYATDVEILRLHYALTLRAWRERFLERRDAVADLYDERFCRMWEFYLAGSEATFQYGGHINFQIQVCKDINAVPLTRDYIAVEESQIVAAERRTAAPLSTVERRETVAM